MITAITTNIGAAKIFVQPDMGYDILTATIKYLGGGIQIVFFLMSTISFFFLFKAIKLYAALPSTTLLIYFSFIFFILDMSGMRQAVAVAICLYSVHFITDKKFNMYVLCVFLATLFHWSSILLLPLYWILGKRYNVFLVLSTVLISLTLFLLHVKWLSSVIIFLLPYLTANAKLIEKMVIYTSDKSFAGGWETNVTVLFNVFSSLVLLIILMWKKKVLGQKFRYFQVFFNLYFFQLVLYFSISELSEIAERLRLFFLVSNVILLPYLIVTITERRMKALMALCIILYCFANCRAYVLDRPATIAYHPYQNYLIYKGAGLESTGYIRLKEHYREFAKNNR